MSWTFKSQITNCVVLSHKPTTLWPRLYNAAGRVGCKYVNFQTVDSWHVVISRGATRIFSRGGPTGKNPLRGSKCHFFTCGLCFNHRISTSQLLRWRPWLVRMSAVEYQGCHQFAQTKITTFHDLSTLYFFQICSLKRCFPLTKCLIFFTILLFSATLSH